ncbi:MAG: sensor histidine kinase [Phycisphaerales bacterium]
MKPRHRVTWLIFAVCVLAVIEALGWVTWQAVRAERRERQARAQAQMQESIQLALWRMEFEIAPIMAREAARPYFHYRPFYPAERAYTRMWQEVEPGEVLVPSPLLESAGQFVRLHFQVERDGHVTSPQAPAGNMRDLAESQYVDGEFIVMASELLDRLTRLATAPVLSPTDRGDSRLTLGATTGAMRDVPAPSQTLEPRPIAPQTEQWFDKRASEEFAARQQAATQSANAPELGKRARPQRFAGREEQTTTIAAVVPPPAAEPAPSDPAPPAVAVPEAPESTRLGLKQLAEGAFDPKSADAKRLTVAKPTVAEKEGEAKDGETKRDGAEAPAAKTKGADGLADQKAEFDDSLRIRQNQGYSLVEPEVRVGALEPAWVIDPGTSTPELLIRREVVRGDGRTTQGLWVDWPALRQRLLVLVADLFPTADLVPLVSAAAPGPRLAGIPAVFVSNATLVTPAVAFGSTQIVLTLTWLAVLGAIIAIALVLRASMELGDRRGRFVSAVTHELRTPLTTFCLYTDMLARGMVREPAAQAEYFQTLQRESGRLTRIVENVLEYARLGTPRQREAASIPAEGLVQALVASATRAAEAVGMSIELGTADLGGLEVEADSATVERVLMNLVENSCKYSADAADRRINLNARRARAKGRWWLELRVRDHGPGIPPEVQKRIFRAFCRARRDETKEGLGLGLALADGMIRGVGGSISLVRDTATGAEFTVFIPARDRTE